MNRIILYLAFSLLVFSCNDAGDNDAVDPENSATIDGKQVNFDQVEGTDTGSGYEVVLKAGELDITIHLSGKEYGTYQITDGSSGGRIKQEYASYATCMYGEIPMIATGGSFELKSENDYALLTLLGSFVFSPIGQPGDPVRMTQGKAKIKGWGSLGTSQCRLAHWQVNFAGSDNQSLAFEYNSAGRMSRFTVALNEDEGSELETVDALLIYEGDHVTALQYIQSYYFNGELLEKQTWFEKCYYIEGLLSKIENYQDDILKSTALFSYNTNRTLNQLFVAFPPDNNGAYSERFTYDENNNVTQITISTDDGLETLHYTEYDNKKNPYLLLGEAIGLPFFPFIFDDGDGYDALFISANNVGKIPTESLSIYYGEFTNKGYPQSASEFYNYALNATYEFDYTGCN